MRSALLPTILSLLLFLPRFCFYLAFVALYDKHAYTRIEQASEGSSFFAACCLPSVSSLCPFCKKHQLSPHKRFQAHRYYCGAVTLSRCCTFVFWYNLWLPSFVRGLWSCAVRSVRYRDPSWHPSWLTLAHRKYGLFGDASLLGHFSPASRRSNGREPDNSLFAGAPFFTMARILTWIRWVSPPHSCSR